MKSVLYTRTGDGGSTSLVGGARTPKDTPRLEAYGTVDELNSWLGIVAATSPALPVEKPCTFWTDIQSRLFDIGGYLATDPDGEYASMTAHPVGAPHIEEIERAIDSIDSALPRIHSFVIPGGDIGACNAHVARTVCRRAERRIISLSAVSDVDSNTIRYINRLSDLLFAVARFCNINAGRGEILWSKSCLD